VVALLGALPLVVLFAVRWLRRRRLAPGEAPGPAGTTWRVVSAVLKLLPVAPGALLAVVLAVVIDGALAALMGAGASPTWPGWGEPLAVLGVRGIGSTPALIALTLYALLPMVRNTYTGLAGVPREATEAGRGMGMSPRQ